MVTNISFPQTIWDRVTSLRFCGCTMFSRPDNPD